MARRIACLDISAFPLQLMLAAHPDWRALPAVVVDEDRPQGLVLWVNARARAAGVLPGQRYAAALGICRELRAGVILPAVTGQGIARTMATLRAFTPDIEASPEEPGVFWLDATGLTGIFTSLDTWARKVLEQLAADGFSSSLAVGFTRFGTYALARRLSASSSAEHVDDKPNNYRLLVIDTRSTEVRLTGSVKLAYLNLKPSVRDRLDRLGVRTVTELITLPAAGLVKRYGRELLALHRLATGEIAPHLHPDAEPITLSSQTNFDEAERNSIRLLFHLKTLLDALIPRVAARDAWIGELLLSLGFEKSATSHDPVFVDHRLRPAAPSLDAALFLDLLRLRLEQLDISAGLIAVRLELIPTTATHDQIRLFQKAPRRDPAAAAAALARVRAELGEESVGRFRLRDGHLPRATFTFEPLQDKPLPAPDPQPGLAADTGGLVRLIHQRPVPLRPGILAPPPGQSASTTGGQGVATLPPLRAPFTRLFGPWVISGGWWQRQVHRTYLWAETDAGALLWLYWDATRRTWFEEGRLA